MEVYRNNHTTSTKCQYHAAHSNPTMCGDEFLKLLNRISDTVRNVEPIITWIPWKPVAMKNVDPKAESRMENEASLYSNA